MRVLPGRRSEAAALTVCLAADRVLARKQRLPPRVTPLRYLLTLGDSASLWIVSII